MKQKRSEETQGRWIKIVGILAACGILIVLVFNALSAIQSTTRDLQREAQIANEARDSALEELDRLNTELDRIAERYAKARADLVEKKIRHAATDVYASELLGELTSGARYTPLIAAAAEYCIREEYRLFQSYLNGESEEFSDEQLSKFREYSRYQRGNSSGTNPVDDYCFSEIGGSLFEIAGSEGREMGERVRGRILDRVATLCFALDVQVYDDFDDWDRRYFTSQQIERYEAYNAVKDTDEDAHPSAGYCLEMLNQILSEIGQSSEE